jgi:hypothetical protein
MSNSKPKHGDLRTWWVAQVPGEAFHVYVKTPLEAKILLDTLALYDEFQYNENVKGDYSNAGGLSVFDANDDHDGPEGSWVDFYDAEGNDIDFYELEDLRKMKKQPVWEGLR